MFINFCSIKDNKVVCLLILFMTVNIICLFMTFQFFNSKIDNFYYLNNIRVKEYVVFSDITYCCEIYLYILNNLSFNMAKNFFYRF